MRVFLCFSSLLSSLSYTHMSKKQCIRDAPCNWIPSCAGPTLASLLAPSPQIFAPPPTTRAESPCLFADLAPRPPTPDSPVPPWGWTQGASAAVSAQAPPSPNTIARDEQLERLQSARLKSLRFRDARWPSPGLLKDEGGVFDVLERSIRSGRSWL